MADSKKTTTRKKKNLAGRPSKMTKDVVKKLEYAFSRGLNIVEACLYADISTPTFYSYANQHDGFLSRCEELRKKVSMQAKLNLAEKIDEGDEYNSRWYLEKTSDEFNPKTKQEVTGKDGGAITVAFKWDDE